MYEYFEQSFTETIYKLLLISSTLKLFFCQNYSSFHKTTLALDYKLFSKEYFSCPEIFIYFCRMDVDKRSSNMKKYFDTKLVFLKANPSNYFTFTYFKFGYFLHSREEFNVYLLRQSLLMINWFLLK